MKDETNGADEASALTAPTSDEYLGGKQSSDTVYMVQIGLTLTLGCVSASSSVHLVPVGRTRPLADNQPMLPQPSLVPRLSTICSGMCGKPGNEATPTLYLGLLGLVGVADGQGHVGGEIARLQLQTPLQGSNGR